MRRPASKPTQTPDTRTSTGAEPKPGGDGLEERAQRGDRARFEAVLDKVRARGALPEPGDEP